MALTVGLSTPGGLLLPPARQDEMSERKSNTGSGEREAARHPGYAAPFIGSTAAPGTPPAQGLYDPVSYTHLTLPTNREV